MSTTEHSGNTTGPKRREAARGRRRRGSGLLAGALAAVALVASACSSASRSPGTAAPTTTASPSTTGGGDPSLVKIETELAVGAPTFVATYTFTDTVHANASGTYVVAHAGNDGLLAVHDNGVIEQIVVGGKTYFCGDTPNEPQFAGDTGWLCLYGPGSKHLPLEFADVGALIGAKAALSALRASNGLTTTSTGVVDGRSVSCARSRPGASDQLTVCVLADGVLAEFESQSSSGTRKVLLSSISTSVPSDEFALPAKPHYLSLSSIQ